MDEEMKSLFSQSNDKILYQKYTVDRDIKTMGISKPSPVNVYVMYEYVYNIICICVCRNIYLFVCVCICVYDEPITNKSVV